MNVHTVCITVTEEEAAALNKFWEPSADVPVTRLWDVLHKVWGALPVEAGQ